MLETLAETVTLTVFDGEVLTEMLPHDVDDGETLDDTDADPDTENEATPDSDALCDGDSVLVTMLVVEPQPVVEGLALAVDVPVDDAVLDPVLDGLAEEDTVADDVPVLV